MRKGTLIIMSKLPRIGKIKTRLVKDMGQLKASRFYTNTLSMILMTLSRKESWATYFYTDTRKRTKNFSEWRRPFRYSKQLLIHAPGNIGIKMLKGLENFSRGQPTVIIGGDIPEVKNSHIQKAFKNLNHFDAVFGPSIDGGFWLIGFANRRPFWRPFNNIRWSTEHTLTDSIERMKNRRIGFIDELSDIDDIRSYNTWKNKNRFRKS